MKVLIIGSKGSMGRRYQAILNHLSIPFTGVDLTSHSEQEIEDRIESNDYDHFIIATPTNTHYSYLRSIKRYLPKKKVLCEKPITMNIEEMKEISKWDIDLTMMYQYKYATVNKNQEQKDGSMKSHYSFYNHGNDGLAWDCIQLIGLSQNEIELSEDTPLWSMSVNGFDVNRASIDKSYVEFIKAWITDEEKQTMEELIELHIKTEKLNKKVQNDGQYDYLNWSTSTH